MEMCICETPKIETAHGHPWCAKCRNWFDQSIWDAHQQRVKAKRDSWARRCNPPRSIRGEGSPASLKAFLRRPVTGRRKIK